MKPLENYVRIEIDTADSILRAIEKYPESFQPYAEHFWRGRKTQATEILVEIIKNEPNTTSPIK